MAIFIRQLYFIQEKGQHIVDRHIVLSNMYKYVMLVFC